MTELGKRTIQVGITLGAIVGLIGCADQVEGIDMTSDEAFNSINGFVGGNGFNGSNGFNAVNGFNGSNGMTGTNGMLGANGFSSLNGFVSSNGIQATNGYMTTDGGRKTIEYLVRCALHSTDTLVKQDQNGVNYTFGGGLNLCPQWKNAGVGSDDKCQELVSACMMAHVNTAGIHIPIWLDAQTSNIGWGVDLVNYPYNEGSFFGNIITTGALPGKAQVTGPKPYYCDGIGFPGGINGVVAGRLGAGQAGAPYMNPFGNGALCQNSPQNVAYYTKGISGQPAPDGYQKLEMPVGTAWGYPITVWRNATYTPKFSAAYKYALSARMTSQTPRVVDAVGTSVRLWAASANFDSSRFALTADGSNWKIALKTDATKCLDAGGGGNGQALTIATCAGVNQQRWNVTVDPRQTGAFIFKVVSTNRCLNHRGGGLGDGTVMEVADCNGSTESQMFIVAAVSSGGTPIIPGAGAPMAPPPPPPANPCASFCTGASNFTGPSYQSGNLGTGAICKATYSSVTNGGMSNMDGRTFKINGVTKTGTSFGSMPAKVNGGYCFQAAAGGNTAAAFYTY
jgi:ricin-type beta-trefoil lectin protein